MQRIIVSKLKGKLTAKKIYKLKLFFILLPFLLVVIAFSYVPLLGWMIAFVDYLPGVPFHKQEFIGLQSFKLVFAASRDMLLVLRNTLVLSGIGILISPIPALFAILLTELRSKRLSKVVQIFSTIPYFFSWVIIYTIFYSVFSTQDGVLNIILMKLGLISQPTDILVNSDAAWGVQSMVGLYKTLGYNAIIYIAAIAGIDTQLYDAASVDGAGRLRRAIHITIPCLLPTFFVLFILSLGNILSAGGFDQYYVFSNSFVVEKLEVLDTYTYKIGILNNNYSYATAVGMMKSIVSVVLVFFANYMSKLIRGRGIM